VKQRPLLPQHCFDFIQGDQAIIWWGVAGLQILQKEYTPFTL